MNTQISHSLSAEGPGDERLIRRLLEDMSDAVRRQDLHAILAPYADDAVIFDCREALQTDKDGLRAGWKECFEASDHFNLEFRDLRVRVSGDIAFAYALMHSLGKDKFGSQVDLWMRYSTALRKDLGKWQIVHEHISVPGNFENGKMLQNLKPQHDLRH